MSDARPAAPALDPAEQNVIPPVVDRTRDLAVSLITGSPAPS